MSLDSSIYNQIQQVVIRHTNAGCYTFLIRMPNFWSSIGASGTKAVAWRRLDNLEVAQCIWHMADAQWRVPKCFMRQSKIKVIRKHLEKS